MARKAALVLIEDEQGSWGVREKESLQGIDEAKDWGMALWENKWTQFSMDIFYLVLFVKGFQNFNRSGYDKVALIATSIAKFASLAADSERDVSLRKNNSNGN